MSFGFFYICFDFIFYFSLGSFDASSLCYKLLHFDVACFDCICEYSAILDVLKYGTHPAYQHAFFLFPAGDRILAQEILVGNNPLDLAARYSVTIKGYLSHGKDGYDMLMGRPVLAQAESLPQLATLIKDHFDALAYLNAKRVAGDSAASIDETQLPVTVRQHLELCESSPHVGTGEESSGQADPGQLLTVCATTDSRIQCLALVNN